MKKTKVSLKQIKGILLKILLDLGYNQDEAKMIADEFIENELLNKSAIGLKVFKKLVGYNKNNRKTSIKVNIKGNVTIIDAGGRFSQTVARTAIDLLVNDSKKDGVCLVGIKNNTSFLKAGYLVRKLVEKNLVGISFMFVDARFSSPPEVASPLFGTNPMAIGIPCGKYKFLYDSSTTALSGGRKKELQETGIEKVETSAGVNHEGKTTNVLSDMVSILPLGGSKGFGLLLAMELMAGSLLGYSIDDKKSLYHADNGLVTIAVDPEKFGSIKDFNTRNEKLVEILKKESGGKVYIPGESYKNLKTTKKYLYLEKSVFDEISEML